MTIKDLFLSFEKKRNLNQDIKRKIAAKALEFISVGDEIFLGAGTTISYLGEELAKSGKHFMLKIWTNNVFVTSLWLKNHDKVFEENFIGITAGEVSRKNLSIVNLIAPFSRIEKSIIGTPGISTKGLSADDMDTVQQIEFIGKRTKNIIILADSSKIGRECTYITRSIRMIKLDIKNGKKYILITNSSLDNLSSYVHTISKLKEIGFQILTI
jgi:DeoR/GlpR family transcriptional regulator of sugar metabolism